MATLRKGKAYKKIVRPYTRRSKFKKKGFIKVIQDPKITKFRMGDLKKEFPKKVKVISKERFQIRHNSLESCRMLVNRQLIKKFGSNGYQFIINLYPHHILRENKMLTGAGSDRMQSGMSHAFGKSIGSAAQVKQGTVIFTVCVNENSENTAKKILEMTKSRIAGKVKVEME